MTTKPHSKTVRTQATIKKVKSLILKISAQSKIHCIETRNVLRHSTRGLLTMDHVILNQPTSGSADIEKSLNVGKPVQRWTRQMAYFNDIIIKITHIARVQTHAEILESLGKEKARAMSGHAASEKLKFVFW
ncbi:hypothetical protein TNCV_4280221 [Trichonephila clavipes]|nr:hypothetical protein TNCV_4280221 [Trichonephila clavipes]